MDLYLHQQGMGNTTPAAKANFQIRGVFAQFERFIIGERINTELTGTRANGKRLGRSKVDETIEEAI